MKPLDLWYNLNMVIDYIKNLILGVAEKNPSSKIVNLFKKNAKIINLKNHGLIAVGNDLKETVNYVLR